MAGYNGYSMSNNAVEAYDMGYMPKSKWTKAAMLDAIKEYLNEEYLDNDNNKLDISLVEKMSKELMFKTFFCYKEWHHTSSHYNRVDFYGIDAWSVEHATNKDIERMIAEKAASKEAAPKEKDTTPQGMYLCEFKHWTGTRKHPKCNIVQAVGEIKGKRFYSDLYGVKNISTDEFKIIEKAR